MPSVATLHALFSSASEIQGAGRIYSRRGSAPVPFCQTLINLDHLEQVLLEEHACSFPASLLSADENELFSSFAYRKRRREWLGGRLAAKAAALKLLQIDSTPNMMAALSILPAEDGSPRLSSSILAAATLPVLSISHSDRFAVAMAAKAASCGIDIQKISEQTERVAERFSEPGELQLLLDHAPLLSVKERLTLLWSAKEALKKALLHDQPVIFQGVVLRSLTADHSFTLRLNFPGDGNCPAEVTAMLLEDCILAYTFVRTRHA